MALRSSPYTSFRSFASFRRPPAQGENSRSASSMLRSPDMRTIPIAATCWPVAMAAMGSAIAAPFFKKTPPRERGDFVFLPVQIRGAYFPFLEVSAVRSSIRSDTK